MVDRRPTALKDVKNIYQIKLAHHLAFVKDEETYEKVRKAIMDILWQELQQEIARVEEEKGYTSQTYQELLDGKIVLK